MEHGRTYEHGFTQRTHLMSDIERIREILKEHEQTQSERCNKESLVEYAENVHDRITNGHKWDRMKGDKIQLLDILVKLYTNTDKTHIANLEHQIKKIVGKYKGATRNILSSWLSNVRQQMNARKDNII